MGGGRSGSGADESQLKSYHPAERAILKTNVDSGVFSQMPVSGAN